VGRTLELRAIQAPALLGLRFLPVGAETHDVPGHDVAVQRVQLESLLRVT
jgi:hypothetical protein